MRTFLLHRRPFDQRGQTILEMVYLFLWMIFFFGAMYYVATVYDVTQKQTMLLRNQAFMELGNYSHYGAGRHGEEDAKDDRAQTFFLLGEKTENVKVDLEKNAKFKDAVSGDLEVEIVKVRNSRRELSWDIQAKEKSPLWDAYSLPRANTVVRFFAGEVDDTFEFSLATQLGIAHNRSIDLKKKVDPSEYKEKTGLFSGSMHLNQFNQLQSLETKIGQGMLDNLERTRAALRQLVKNDPSLAEEAEDLEKNLNATIDSITGGAVAALISMAIQVVMAAGMDAMKGAFSDASVASSAGKPPGSFLENYFKPYFNDWGSAINGSYVENFVNAATAPIRMPFEGAANFSNGLAGLSAGGGAQSAFQAMQGLSQIGQTAQFAMGIAGEYNQGLGIAVQALALPSSVNSGLAAMESASTEGFTSVVQALPQVTAPITAFATTIAPELGAPLGMVNMGVGMAGAAAGMPGMAADLGSGTLNTADTLKAMGGLLASSGQIVSGAASLTGGDPTVGSIMSMAGGGLAMAGKSVDFVNDLKLKGIDTTNPLNIIGEKIKENITNAQASIDKFQTDISQSIASTSAAVDELFKKGTKVQDQGMLASLKELNEKTTGVFSSDRLAETNSLGGLLKAGAFTDKLEGNLLMQMQASGATPDQLVQAQAHFAKVKAGLEVAQGVKLGAMENTSPEALASMMQGKNSADALNAMLNESFQKQANAQKQIIGINYGNSNAMLAQLLTTYGQTYESAKAIEKEMNEKNPVGQIASNLQGSVRTAGVYMDQVQAAEKVVKVAVYEEILKTEMAKKMTDKQRADQILEASEKISLQGPMLAMSNDANQQLKYAAKEGRAHLEKMLPEVTDENTKARYLAQINKLDTLSQGLNADFDNAMGLMKAQAKIESAREALQKMEAGMTEDNRKIQTITQKLETLRTACASGQC